MGRGRNSLATFAMEGATINRVFIDCDWPGQFSYSVGERVRNHLRCRTMATTSAHKAAIQTAVASNNSDATWAAFWAAWKDGVNVSMTAETFNELFRVPSLASAAVELAARSMYARQTIRTA